MAVDEKQPVVSDTKEPISSSGSSSGDATEEVEDGEYGSLGRHIFSDEKVAAYWTGVYEKAKYEGRHRFDPTYKWTAAEEKTLLKKVSSTIQYWEKWF